MTVFKILDVNQQRKSPEKWETNRVDPATAHLLPCWFSGQNIHRGPPGAVQRVTEETELSVQGDQSCWISKTEEQTRKSRPGEGCSG